MRVADIFCPSLAIAGCSTVPGPTAMILKAAEHGCGWDHPWSGSAPWTAVRNPRQAEAYSTMLSETTRSDTFGQLALPLFPSPYNHAFLLTRDAGHRFAPPPEVLARLTAQLRSQSQLQTKPQTQTNPQPQTKMPARIYSVRPAAWAALAAAILLTISLLSGRQLHQTKTLAAELLDQHLATLSSAATPQVISTDRHTVKPWFQGRLPFTFNLPDAAALPPDTTLKGADLTYLNGQPVALLLLTIHKHEVSIFLTQRSTSPTLSILPGARAGFTVHTASTPDLRIIAVSDVNPADLDNLLAVLVQTQNPE
jgi:anti-sigma factor RsiW